MKCNLASTKNKTSKYFQIAWKKFLNFSLQASTNQSHFIFCRYKSSRGPVLRSNPERRRPQSLSSASQSSTSSNSSQLPSTHNTAPTQQIESSPPQQLIPTTSSASAQTPTLGHQASGSQAITQTTSSSPRVILSRIDQREIDRFRVSYKVAIRNSRTSRFVQIHFPNNSRL